MRRSLASFGSALVGLLSLAACQPAEPVPVLSPGETTERRIAPGERHVYELIVDSGDFLEIEVEQQSVDVVARLLGPRRELLLVSDLSTGEFGPEPLLAIAPQTGSYWIEVEAWDSETSQGRYQVTFKSTRATALDHLKAEAAKSFSVAEQRSWNGEFRAALESYDKALDLWRQAEDEFWQAESLTRKGNALSSLDRWRPAAEAHEQAAKLFRNLGKPRFEAFSLNDLGAALFHLGELEEALVHHRRALELRQELRYRLGMAISLQSLADIYKVQGETQKALDHFLQALELTDRPADRRFRAHALHNLGTLYLQSGKYEEAQDHLVQAERIFADLGEPSLRASSLSQLGQVAFELKDYGGALLRLRQALEIRRKAGDPRGQAVVLRRIGTMLHAHGEKEEARRHFSQALDLLNGMESPRTRASVLVRLGFLHDELGRFEEALAYHSDAVSLFEKVGDLWGQAEGLLGVATSRRHRGDLAAARRTSEQALNIAETLRSKPFSEDLRWSFFSTAQRFFEFHIDLLMDLQRAEPSGQHAAAGLEVSERARARSLLDLLSESGAEIRTDAAPELLAEEQVLQKRLSASAALIEDGGEPGSQRLTREQVRQDIGRLYEVRAAIRRQSPHYADLTQPEPVSLLQIQQQLLDRETLLLEYKLGRERSFLWLVGTDTFASFELAPGEDIERSVRRAYRLLKLGDRRESEALLRDLLCDLSQKLLRPVAGRLGHRRLAIVADGALQYLPFAALPDPDVDDACDQGPPLIADHEIVYLPSASTLAVLRRERRRQPTPSGLVAVLADPVFGPWDERVERRVPNVGAEANDVDRGDHGTDSEQGPRRLRRLHHSRAEAASILRLVPTAHSYQALDFAASKETVLSGALADYRVVHFATHGIIDVDRPELSGVVLSQIDRDGRPIDGFLGAHEIYNLRLPAELVVLGACETALGREVKGEGLVGLTRGFMYAGASRVIVSLWRVGDRGTSELMVAFYEALLKQQAAPSAALRTAQLAMREQRAHPFHWAGFVLQGEWRSGNVRINNAVGTGS